LEKLLGTIKIIKFEVWFLTPFGLCETIDEAKKAMDQNELPMGLLKLLPVAIGENRSDYEVYFP
jgi:hypothetical protein